MGKIDSVRIKSSQNITIKPVTTLTIEVKLTIEKLEQGVKYAQSWQ